MNDPAKIEREIDQDRLRIEAKIGAIQDRLSPDQLIDEALAYAEGHGGAEFTSNLKTSAVADPLPIALIRIGLAWLIAKPLAATNVTQPSRAEAVQYPLAPITGEIRRSRSTVLESNKPYSYFQDTTGKRFRARADETGRRASHFMDDAGNAFRGFVDASGREIDRITDKAGNALKAASGWAERAWSAVTDALCSATSSVSNGSGSLRSSAFASMDVMQRFDDVVQSAFKDQPLFGGALAFAFGTALLRTEQENILMGETASGVKKTLKAKADKALEKGDALTFQAMGEAAAVAADVGDVAKDRITEQLGKIGGPSSPKLCSQSSSAVQSGLHAGAKH